MRDGCGRLSVGVRVRVGRGKLLWILLWILRELLSRGESRSGSRVTLRLL